MLYTKDKSRKAMTCFTFRTTINYWAFHMMRAEPKSKRRTINWGACVLEHSLGTRRFTPLSGSDINREKMFSLQAVAPWSFRFCIF